MNKCKNIRNKQNGINDTFIDSMKNLKEAKESHSLAYEKFIDDSLKVFNDSSDWKKDVEEKVKKIESGNNSLESFGMNAGEYARKYMEDFISREETSLKFKFLQQAFKLQNNPKNVIIIDKEMVAPECQRGTYLDKAVSLIAQLSASIGFNKEADFYCDPVLSCYLKLSPLYTWGSSSSLNGIHYDGSLVNNCTESTIRIYKCPSDSFKDTLVSIPQDKLAVLTDEEKYRFKLYFVNEKKKERSFLAEDNTKDIYLIDKDNYKLYSNHIDYPEPATFYNQGYLVCDGIIYQINITGFTRGGWEYYSVEEADE